MRILFFAWTSQNPASPAHGYSGGGWIAALQRELKAKGLQLGFASLTSSDRWFEHDGYRYYNVGRENKSWKERILVGLNPKNTSYEEKRDDAYLKKFQKVIEDFMPDIIHVFGSEQCYGLITKYTDVPVVLHLQGILNVYWNAFLSPGVSLLTYCLQSWNLKKIWSRYQQYWEWYRTCSREREILRHCKYFIGRTDWDKGCVSVFGKGYRYFYGGEMLRAEFYDVPERQQPEKLTIVTTISGAVYKGYDMILKTAKILKDIVGEDFSWKVFGNVAPSFYEKHLKIKHEDVNVELCGVADASMLIGSLTHCTLYFHPSYIENSSNSICEAQMCGCPVVACFIGGNDSLVQHGTDGFLVPANDPYMAVSRIMQLQEDRTLNRKMGLVGRETAGKRHDKDVIVNGLLEIFNKVKKDDKLYQN